MGKEWKDADIEELLRKSSFSDPSHKNSLREKLFESEQTLELDLDDLSLAAGGQQLPLNEQPVSKQPASETSTMSGASFGRYNKYKNRDKIG